MARLRLICCDTRPDIAKASRQLWTRWADAAELDGFDSVAVSCETVQAGRWYLSNWAGALMFTRRGEITLAVDSDVLPLPGAVVRRSDVEPGPGYCLTGCLAEYSADIMRRAIMSGFWPDPMVDYLTTSVVGLDVFKIRRALTRTVERGRSVNWECEEPAAECSIRQVSGMPSRTMLRRYVEDVWVYLADGAETVVKNGGAFIHFGGPHKGAFAESAAKLWGVDYERFRKSPHEFGKHAGR